MPLIDETGNRYGGLTVLSKTKDKNGRTAWLCQCECGNQKIARGSDLRKGKITSCGQAGCKIKAARNSNFIDETGKRYGRLTVLKKLEEKSSCGKVLWECQCDCGNLIKVISADLRKGTTQSCGCLARELSGKRWASDLTGQKFGLLTALEPTAKRNGQGSVIWKCRCDCGNECEVAAVYLKSGNTKSCGCLLSWAEKEIEKILIQNAIAYKHQQTFSNLVSEKNIHYRYDFGLYYNNKLIGLIEYHGRQHYEPSTLGKYKDPLKNFDLQKERDKLKKEYCEQNNIPLLVLNKDNELEKEILIFYERIKTYGKI